MRGIFGGSFVTLAFVTLAGCGSSGGHTRGGGTGGAGGPDVIVWSADAGESVWFRDGHELARRKGVVVAAGGELWAVEKAKGIGYDHGSCVDGCENCGEEDDAPSEPKEPDEIAVDDYVARPLAGGEPILLASQLEGSDDVSCGVPGRPPELLGGMESRVSLFWIGGMTTSAAVGEESGPEGAWLDLALPRGEKRTVALAQSAALLAAAKAELTMKCEPDEYECEGASEQATITAPIAFRLSLTALGDGGADIEVTAIAGRDSYGITYDETTDLPTSTAELGLGEVPADAVRAAVAAFRDANAWGYSHPSAALLTQFTSK